MKASFKIRVLTGTVLLANSTLKFWIFFFNISMWAGFVFLFLVGFIFSPLPHKKYKCAFMFPRNMTTSKWGNHKSGLQGCISILQNKKRNRDLDGICAFIYFRMAPRSDCCPMVIAAHWICWWTAQSEAPSCISLDCSCREGGLVSLLFSSDVF